jgi:putative membrane protein
MKKYIKEKGLDLIKGLAIGVAFIIPGVSGGTMAVLLNLYDKIINSINNLTKKFFESFKILLPIALGAVLAILICWYPFKLAFEHIMIVMVTLFAGFILGGMPGIFDEVKGVKVKPVHIIAMIISIVFAVGLGALSVLFELNIQSLYDSRPWWLYILVLLAGIISSFALVMPGISGSMILIVLGFYTPTLNLIDNFLAWTDVWASISILATLAVGVVIGVLLASKIIAFFLNRFRTGTFYAIIGIIIGSLIAIYYNYEIYDYYLTVGVRWWEILISGIALVIGGAVSYLIVRYSRTSKMNKEVKNS